MSLTIFSPESQKMYSQRRLETYDRYARLIRWGRRYPVAFAERVFGITSMDYQSYAIGNTWTSQFASWLEGRNLGKTTKAAIYIMLRSVLFPYHISYCISNVGAQAKEVFLKLEHIAKREIESFVGSTDVFMNEVDGSPQGGGTGFIHDVNGFRLRLFNAAEVHTLNSDPTSVKGRRAHLLFIDEAGWVSDELMVQVENFVNQSADFKLGGGVDLRLEPKGFPRQIIYGSSASDTDSPFYIKTREFARKMLMGDRRYFVCDFTADVGLASKVHGVPSPVPLISPDKVEQLMTTNPEKGARELYNHFSTGVHEGQILTMRDLMEHTRQELPQLDNPDGSRQFMFSWDSARMNDNSVIEAAEIINDPQIGWRMKLVNVNSLVDTSSKKKTPMRLPDQVKEFKRMLLAYNGTSSGKLDYENIIAVVGDAGAAGQLIGGVSDYLLEDWQSEDGVTHRGLIDTTHKANETAKNVYRNAVDIMKLVDPKGNRSLIFQAMKDMVRLGVVEFPTEYDVSKDYVVFVDENGEERRHSLSLEEQVALTNIDLLRTEITTMCEYRTADTVTYNFPPDKRGIMHDDRVFAFGLLCWQLAQMRRGQVINKPPEPVAVEHVPLVSAVEF